MENKDSCENRIISLIFTASRNLRQESRENELDEAERLSMTQLETLKFIDERKNPLMKDVADYLFIAPPSITPLIDGLETRKLVKRGSSKNDRRAILISLTDKGKDILEKTMNKKMKRMGDVFKKLTKEEQKSLIRILEKLSAPKQ
ncbi:MAG TPA: MarR family transcriptional regulator [Candidatus Moranbacteria bacterium]|jgi:DNA-binding MarR family transcriptional regulator|nr:MarR family transcriptional regulator [Candidatus Moranbacteria bacterium]